MGCSLASGMRQSIRSSDGLLDTPTSRRKRTPNRGLDWVERHDMESTVADGLEEER
jgi:hypothetical protein